MTADTQASEERETRNGAPRLADGVELKLRPVGLVATGEANGQPELKKVDPLLALKFRAGVVPERVVNGVATFLRPLFLPPVVVGVLAALAALDVWLFGYHGIAQSLRETL